MILKSSSLPCHEFKVLMVVETDPCLFQAQQLFHSFGSPAQWSQALWVASRRTAIVCAWGVVWVNCWSCVLVFHDVQVFSEAFTPLALFLIFFSCNRKSFSFFFFSKKKILLKLFFSTNGIVVLANNVERIGRECLIFFKICFYSKD